MIFNSITPASGGGSNVNTCTMTIDADGVTCSDFSDHTPTAEYAVVAVAAGSSPIFLFYVTSSDQSLGIHMFGASDTTNPAWWGFLSDPYNSVTLLEGSVIETYEPGFYLYEGTYTGVVIEP